MAVQTMSIGMLPFTRPELLSGAPHHFQFRANSTASSANCGRPPPCPWAAGATCWCMAATCTLTPGGGGLAWPPVVGLGAVEKRPPSCCASGEPGGAGPLGGWPLPALPACITPRTASISWASCEGLLLLCSTAWPMRVCSNWLSIAAIAQEAGQAKHRTDNWYGAWVAVDNTCGRCVMSCRTW